jgi:6-phosphogluconolactonase
MKNTSVKIFANLETISLAAVEIFFAEAKKAIQARGKFHVVLSGGRTPEKFFLDLSAASAQGASIWPNVQFYFSDERAVPPDDEQSNYRMAKERLFSHLPIQPSQVHRIQGELPAKEAAEAYQKDLEASFEIVPPEIPRFDLMFLGMGADGHTASLFPGGSLLSEKKLWVAGDRIPQVPTVRISLTFPLLNHARATVVMVAGEDKAAMIERVFSDGPDEKIQVPIQKLKPAGDGQCLWFLDEKAASLLKGR